MALPATHIRFALDVKSKYQPENLAEYLSGSIYPDSRYVTKINRIVTHDQKILVPSFAKSDFSKGWQAHLYCDVIQNKIKK